MLKRWRWLLGLLLLTGCLQSTPATTPLPSGFQATPELMPGSLLDAASAGWERKELVFDFREPMGEKYLKSLSYTLNGENIRYGMQEDPQEQIGPELYQFHQSIYQEVNDTLKESNPYERLIIYANFPAGGAQTAEEQIVVGWVGCMRAGECAKRERWTGWVTRVPAERAEQARAMWRKLADAVGQR